MHYANGREAKPGDRVLDINTGQLLVVESVSPASPTSNVEAHPALPHPLWKTCNELIHVDDARATFSSEWGPTQASPGRREHTARCGLEEFRAGQALPFVRPAAG